MCDAREPRRGRRRAAAAASAAIALGLVGSAVDAAEPAHLHPAEPAGEGLDLPANVPPVTPEDRAAAFPDLGDMRAGHRMHEDPFNTFVLLDRLEAAEPDGAGRLDWEVSAWAGRGLRRLWLRSEGERRGGETIRADVELLGGQLIARWWEVVAGVRRDAEPGRTRTWGAFGVQGLAPYGFELEATAYVAEGGRSAARIEAGHELPVTARLILEPSIEVDWYGRSDRERGIGHGLARAEAGLRIRYEIRREVAPYLGIVREKAFGETEALERAAGRDPDESMLVVGIRLWF